MSARPETLLSSTRPDTGGTMLSETRSAPSPGDGPASARSSPMTRWGRATSKGVHYDAVGRIDADFIRANVHQNRADLYYCGPSGFMAGVETALDTLDVPVETRFSEAFAPDRSFGVATA